MQTSLPNDLLFSAYDIYLTEILSREKIITFAKKLRQINNQIIDAQTFQFNSLLNEKHLLSAIWHAWNGFRNNLTISNSLSIEFLLYASGQRQISKAYELIGLADQIKTFSIVIFHKIPIDKNLLLSEMNFSPWIEKIEFIKFQDTLEKKKRLCEIFDYDIKSNSRQESEDYQLTKLENYILTSISNLVFEASNRKNENPNKNQYFD